MARRFKRKIKTAKQRSRILDKNSIKKRKRRAIIHKSKKYIYNLANCHLTDDQYIILGKGLKFIPQPKIYNIRKVLLSDFDEFARKMRCRYHFHDNENGNSIHPFRTKSFHQPQPTCSELENYLDLTKLAISNMPLNTNSYNFTKGQIISLRTLQNMKDIIFSRSDKGGAICLSHRTLYIKEGLRQLNSNHYEEVDKPNLINIKENFCKIFADLCDNNEIDRTTFDYLCGSTETPRMGRLFLLPKIHKLSDDIITGIKNQSVTLQELPPCRPIISQCGSITESISKFIDYFLVPIVKKQDSYIRDSGDFINQIEALHPNRNCFLVSFDCTSMYTNLQFNELRLAVEKAYGEATQGDYLVKLPHTETIVTLLSLVLENNYFEFNGKFYKQIIGASMGSKCSGEICDIRAFEVLNEILRKFTHRHKIAFIGRYRDDFFLVYQGKENEIHDFFNLANTHHQLLKFTYEISDTEMTFLDTTVYKGTRFKNNGILDIKSYIKPTNTHQYLDRSSMHNPSVFSGIIRGESVRHCRNNSDKSHLQLHINNFKQYLLQRGYKDREINENIQHGTSKDRKELLRFTPKNINGIPLVYITKYHFAIRGLGKILRKYFKKILKNEKCKRIFTSPPMIAYSRHKNLKDILTRSLLK